MIAKTQELIKQVRRNEASKKTLSLISTLEKGALDHGLGVANISTFLAINTGYEQQTILENIYLGALLHDFGKTRLSPKVMASPDLPENAEFMRNHPLLGKNALMVEEGFSDEVLKIVAEHHEHFSGLGFPKGKKGTQLYELSKIVSIANDLENLVAAKMPMPGQVDGLRAKQKEAIKVLAQDLTLPRDQKKYDPVILTKCIKAFAEML